MSGTPQRFALGQVLFTIYVSGVDNSKERTLRYFADNTKPSGAVNMPEKEDIIQKDRDLTRRDKWGNVNDLKLNKTKHNVLPTSWKITLATQKADLDILYPDLHQNKHGKEPSGGDSAFQMRSHLEYACSFLASPT